MKNSIRSTTMAVAFIWTVTASLANPLAAAELSGDDRALITELLGAGVVGAAVTVGPLSKKLDALREGTRTYKIVGGKNKGQTEPVVVTQLKRDSSGIAWRYAVGTKNVLFLRAGEDGSVSVISEQDIDEGVVVKYSPGETILVPGLQPGGTKQSSVEVKVYDLSDPADLQHSGRLALTYTYIGGYSVTVPAGTFDAALIKWTYKGKIGPAKVEDTQYRFLAEGAGVVASVDKKDVSAMLVYQDHSKTAKVLQAAP